MSVSEYRGDIYQRAEALFIEQFKGKATFAALIKASMNQVQNAENALRDMLDYRSIDAATGKQLDGIGSIVGELRFGRSDETYRENIKYRVFSNSSEGDPETVIKAIAWITGSTFVGYTELYPAHVVVSFNGTVPGELLETMNNILSGGVDITLIGSGAPGNLAEDMLAFCDVNSGGVTKYTNPVGKPLGLDYGHEVRTNLNERLVFNDGTSLLMTDYDIAGTGNGYGGKLGELYI